MSFEIIDEEDAPIVFSDCLAEGESMIIFLFDFVVRLLIRLADHTFFLADEPEMAPPATRAASETQGEQSHVIKSKILFVVFAPDNLDDDASETSEAASIAPERVQEPKSMEASEIIIENPPDSPKTVESAESSTPIATFTASSIAAPAVEDEEVPSETSSRGEEEEEEEERPQAYIVEKILDRVFILELGFYVYLLHWLNFPSSDDSWEPEVWMCFAVHRHCIHIHEYTCIHAYIKSLSRQSVGMFASASSARSFLSQCGFFW